MGIGVKTKLSALNHSSLMSIDEETGGSEQGIVSSEWCPLIARKRPVCFEPLTGGAHLKKA